MTVSIVSATADDAEAILLLQKMAYQSEAAIYEDFSLPPLTETLEQLRGLFRSHRFLKAIAGQQIIGSVRGVVCEGTCQIGRLIVHPAWQRQGIGTRLLQTLEAQFPEAERFELFTGHQSTGNLRLYEKLGYSRTKTIVVHQRLQLVYLQKPNRPL